MRVILLTVLFLLSFEATAEKIEFSIYEKSSGKLISSGVKEYSWKDIILHPYEKDGEKIVEKFVELDKGFKIGARLFQEPKLTGFGLLAQLTEKDFSWEWFSIVSPGTFRKLQDEKGLVKVRVSGLPMTELLEEVDFIDDATLSFSLGGAGNEESHNIIVKKGSVLKFD